MENLTVDLPIAAHVADVNGLTIFEFATEPDLYVLCDGDRQILIGTFRECVRASVQHRKAA